MGMENIEVKMVEYTKDNGLMINRMVLVLSSGQMGQFMKVCIVKEKKMDMGCINGLMDLFFKECGIKI